MDLASGLAGLAAGVALAGAFFRPALRRARAERAEFESRVAAAESAAREACAALDADNADLRRRLDEVADTLLAADRQLLGQSSKKD